MKKTIIGLLYSGKLEKDLFIKYQNSCNMISENILLLPVTKEVLERRTFALPQGVYNLCYNSNDKIVKDIEGKIGKNKVFNRITKFNKWEIYKLLKLHFGIYLPETAHFTYDTLKTFLEKNDKIILKPPIGKEGQGVILLQKKTEGYFIADKTIDKPIEFSTIEEVVGHIKGFSKGYLVQEYIDNKRVGTNFFDIRIYVQKNIWGKWQITGGISRIAVNKSFITNIVKKVVDFSEPLKGHYCPKLQAEITETIETVSLQVANILDEKLGPLGELAVDYCIGLNDQPYIIEVNGKPMKTLAKRLQSPTLYNNLYLRPMEYAYYLAKKSNTP